MRVLWRSIWVLVAVQVWVSQLLVLKRYYDTEDLRGEEWELNNEEIAALDLQGAASPMEVEGELPDMNAEEMAKEGLYLVKSVLRHRYRQGGRFLTL